MAHTLKDTQIQPNRYAVLYVDDEDVALETFYMACHPYFPVLIASNAADAMALLERHGDEIAVCISDQRMPQQSGVDLLKTARQRYPHVVRLLTSAYANQTVTMEALNEAEVFRYIPKPWDMAGLHLELRHAMDRFLAQQRERALQLERRRFMLRVAEHVVHELRDSITEVAAGLKKLRDYLPPLIAAFDQAVAFGVGNLPVLKKIDRRILGGTLDSLGNRVDEIKLLMDLVVTRGRINPRSLGEHSMAACVEAALSRFPFSKYQRRKIRLNVRDDFYFYGAPPLVIHVLFNLLRNALCAIEQAGGGCIDIRLKSDKNWNRLSIRDEGIGISPQDMPYIYEDFFSTWHSEKSNSGGLGFCREVVEAMGGTLSCESVLGAFSEFTVRLPATALGEAEAASLREDAVRDAAR